MRKKYLKIFSLLIVGALTLYAGANEVKAYDCMVFNRGENTKTYGTLPVTHQMTVQFGTYDYATKTCIASTGPMDAYCAYYWYDPPGTDSYMLNISNNTVYTQYEEITINDLTAMGAAAIIQDTSITRELDDQAKKVVKTTALNLYLSKMTGVNRFAAKSDAAHQGGGTGWNYAKNGIIYKNLNSIDNMVTAFVNSTSGYDAIVGDLYELALGVSTNPNQTSPTIKFTDSTKTFSLKNGVYSATLTVESTVDISALNVSITGINGAATISKNISGKTGTITISFNKNQVRSGITEAEVTVTAIAKQKKAQLLYSSIYANAQPFIVAYDGEGTIAYEDVKITESKKVGLEVLCYRYKTKCNDTKCVNTNSNNERTCYSYLEEYSAISCSADDSSNSASGKKISELIKGVCNLYCMEEGTVSYPGNVRPAITIGTNLEWPTSVSGRYPLRTSSTLTCTIEMDNGEPVTQECINLASQVKYVTGDNSAYVLYNDTKEDKSVNLKQDCSSTTSVNGSNVTITNSCSYTLENTYNTINKETLDFVSNKSIEAAEAAINYVLITQYGGRLPIMGIYWKESDVFTDTLFANPYSLEIKNLSLGYNNEFTTKLNENAYVCNYKVTTDNSGKCVCPPGTEYSGYYLSGLIKDTAQTCAEAKEIYCNNICDKNPELCVCPPESDYTGKDITECLKEPDYVACVADRCYDSINPDPDPDRDPDLCTRPDGSIADITDCLKTNNNDIEYCKKIYGCTYCPPESQHPERDCNAYINGGGTEAECIVNWCNDSSCTGDNCDPECPPGSDYEGMSISDCVSSERGAGNNLTEALNICQKRCYKSGTKGGNIIYRTISLENPFVGKDASTNLWSSGGLMNWMHQVSGVDPSIGLAVYRYPGDNWNSPILVKNKIWYNRGYKASAIYQEATPLYTINLDAKAIKEIRKYNEAEQSKGGYADFELECTDGAYCISSFLHDNIITTADPNLPFLDEQNSTCAKANDKSSFISCYTYK